MVGKDGIKLYFGDCLDIMPTIPENSVDMILCDLPYGTTSRNKWDVVIPFEPLWLQYKRIIKSGGAIVLFAQLPFACDIINSMGSGSTCVACVNTNRKFIGIEKDKGYFEVARNRLEELVHGK